MGTLPFLLSLESYRVHLEGTMSTTELKEQGLQNLSWAC